ncbi:MAG: dTDP-4-dehydrorhamnose 3,5-epimerase [Rhizobiales bacterium]|nr:dTDP-4-dehydrorhamnose 3,5-epimerase [Hyphomicrobiales bacterium]
MSLDVEALAIPDVKIIRPRKFGDSRGFFSETYNKKQFEEAGISLDFVQDNHALSQTAGTVRGLHYQGHPFAQDKLVRVVRGRIYDVAVDIRRASPTLGQWVAVELSADAWNQILVPIGFAHGLCTLEPDTEVIYKVTNYYSVDHDFGIRWNDPDLRISWPISEDQAQLSGKDRAQLFFTDVVNWL